MKWLPGLKGSWLVCTKILTLMPRGWRLLRLDTSGIVVDLTDPPQFSLVKTYGGVLEPAATQFINQHLAKGDVFLDVGANWGYFTCLASKIVGPTGLVVSVEPSARTFTRLCETMSRNRVFNACCIDAAAADGFGLTRMTKRWFRQSTSAHMTGNNGHGTTRCIPIDWIMDNLNFSRRGLKIMKVDAEGAEGLVLKGARHTLKKHHPYVIVEVCDEECKRFGHRPEDVYDFMRSLDYVPLCFLDNYGRGEIRGCSQGTSLVGQIVFANGKAE